MMLFRDCMAIKTPLYTLCKEDVRILEQSNGWLNDNHITAAQQVLAQQFPLVQGLEPPIFQQKPERFSVHTGEFVQVLDIENVHWCVVSTINCKPGAVMVFDTMYRKVPDSIIPVIASLLKCKLPKLEISMMDVGKQSNRSDCGVLAIAIAYYLCAGHNPSSVVYEHDNIRHYLKTSLEKCSFTRFPIRNNRQTIGIVTTKIVELFCLCRMPEDNDPENPFAECTACQQWFHKTCATIPETVFEDENEMWTCCQCDSSQQ